MMTSQPAAARRALSGSRRSQSADRGTTMLSPDTPRVRCSRSTTYEPMNPAPPVTRTRFPVQNPCVIGSVSDADFDRRRLLLRLLEGETFVLEVRLEHHPAELRELNLWLPAQNPTGFRRIAQERRN